MLQTTAYFLLQGQKGGCNKKSAGGVTSTLSLNSFVFCDLQLLFGFHNDDTEKSEGDDSDPPPKRGFLPAPIAALCNMPLSRPQGVAIVGIYPCGKARKPDRSGAPPRFGSGVPFSLSLDDPGPVRAVKGPLCRFAPWTAPGRSVGKLCLRGKGEVGFRVVWMGWKEP